MLHRNFEGRSGEHERSKVKTSTPVSALHYRDPTYTRNRRQNVLQIDDGNTPFKNSSKHVRHRRYHPEYNLEIVEMMRRWSAWRLPDLRCFSENHRKEKILLIRGVRYFSFAYEKQIFKDEEDSKQVRDLVPFTNYVIARYHPNFSQRRVIQKLQRSPILTYIVGFLKVSSGEFIPMDWRLYGRNDYFKEAEEVVAIYERGDNIETSLRKLIGHSRSDIAVLPQDLQMKIQGGWIQEEDWMEVVLRKLLSVFHPHPAGLPPLYLENLEVDQDSLSYHLQNKISSSMDHDRSMGGGMCIERVYKVPMRPKDMPTSWLMVWCIVFQSLGSLLFLIGVYFAVTIFVNFDKDLFEQQLADVR